MSDVLDRAAAGGLGVRCDGVVHLYRTFEGHDVVALRGVDLDDPARRAGGLPGPLGLRQVHAAHPARRHPEAERRPDLPRRGGDQPDGRAVPRPGPGPSGQHHAPGRHPQPAALRHRPAEHRLRPARHGAAPTAAGPPRTASCSTRVGLEAPGRPDRLDHVRRPAAAARPGLRGRDGAAAAARRRADQPAQPRGPRPRPRADPRPRRRPRHHHRRGDPPARGRGDLPAHDHHEGRPGRRRGPRRLGVRRDRRRGRPPPARPTCATEWPQGTLVRIEPEDVRPARAVHGPTQGEEHGA